MIVNIKTIDKHEIMRARNEFLHSQLEVKIGNGMIWKNYFWPWTWIVDRCCLHAKQAIRGSLMRFWSRLPPWECLLFTSGTSKGWFYLRLYFISLNYWRPIINLHWSCQSSLYDYSSRKQTKRNKDRARIEKFHSEIFSSTVVNDMSKWKKSSNSHLDRAERFKGQTTHLQGILEWNLMFCLCIAIPRQFHRSRCRWQWLTHQVTGDWNIVPRRPYLVLSLVNLPTLSKVEEKYKYDFLISTNWK